MDHVEVRQRLADALAAGGLPSFLEADPAMAADAVDAAALRAHLAACVPCRAEAGALVTTGALLAAAAPEDVEAPIAARERILRAVRETGMVRGTPAGADGGGATARRPVVRRWRFAPALAAAAMSLAIVGGLIMVANLGGQRDSARAEVAALADLATASSHILARPDHGQLSLATADGTPGGMIVFSPSSGQVAVWSRALAGAQSGTRYDCYVAHGGTLQLIGWMDQAGDVAYWVGQVPPGITLGQAGDRIVVQAEQPGASPALSGTF